MSTDYTQFPDIQAYLDLNRKIEQTSESSSGMSNSVYFNSSNFAITWLLTANMVPSAIRLSTMQSYVAYYAVAFVGEFISEMLERNGEGDIASYFGTDYDLELDWGDEWYDDLGESTIQAAYDTLMGIQSTIDLIIKGFDLGGLEQTLKDSINGELPRLTYDEKKDVPFWQGSDEYIFKEGGGNDYLDMDKRKKNSTGSKLTVYGGGGDDLIANVYKAYGEDGNDQIRNVSNSAWGGKGDDYITNVDSTAYGEDGDDYIQKARNAYGGAGNDLIENSQDEAHGDAGDDILLNNHVSRGGAGNDYIVGRTSSYDNQVEGFVEGLINTVTGDHAYILDGGSGEDYLEGRNNSEILRGGTGADVLIGGGGNDEIDGGENGDISINVPFTNKKVVLFKDDDIATDVAIFRNNSNFTFTKQSGHWDYQVTGHGTDTFKNIESVVVQAGAGNNTIDASALELPSNLDGQAGNDTIKAGTNSDLLFGGLGNDNLQGNNGDDVLVGAEGRDTLSGGNGKDVLMGGDGNDSLAGGGQADTFVFDSANGIDTINDFNGSQGDIIQVERSVFGHDIVGTSYDASTGELSVTRGSFKLVNKTVKFGAISIKVPTPTFVEVPVQTIATLNNPVGFDASSDVVMV